MIILFTKKSVIIDDFTNQNVVVNTNANVNELIFIMNKFIIAINFLNIKSINFIII